MVATARFFFSDEDLRVGYRKTMFRSQRLQGASQVAAYGLASLANLSGLQPSILNAFRSDRYQSLPELYHRQHLHRRLLSVYRFPKVKVNPGRAPYVNVLVPGFDTKGMSAGFFGVFRVALFMKSIGLNVRLVLFDEYDYQIEEVKKSLKNYPGLENLFDELEWEYVGREGSILWVSPNDTSLATVWYSAYLARTISAACAGKPFIYLIQDYETRFFPENSLSVLAEKTYEFDYVALVSSEPLLRHLLAADVGGMRSRGLPSMHFNNACSANLKPLDEFRTINTRKAKKKLVFYSRPMVDRNMFDLAALTLSEAFFRGIFSPDEWECIGMGMGSSKVEIGDNLYSESLPRMTLSDYVDAVAGFDICLTLMASPHPSMIPMDLAGSGAVVVTNTFAEKTPEYLRSLSQNIVPAEADLEALLAALTEAKKMAEDLDARHRAAAAMTYPTSWDQTLTDEHREFILRVAELPPAGRALSA